MSLSKKYTQDNYMRPDEIDARNVARLLKIIDDWGAEKYASLWHILHDVYEIMFISNPLHWQDFELRHPNFLDDISKGYIDQEQKAFAPYIKPLFLEYSNSDKVKQELERFCKHVEEIGDMNSFAVAASIFEAVSVDGDGKYDASKIIKEEKEAKEKTWSNSYLKWVATYPNPFHRSVADLRVREIAFKTAKPQKFKLGTLEPEAESAWRKRLEPYVTQLKEWCAEQGITQPIIGNIIAHATGSTPFRPYVFNYNFIRECPEKDKIFAQEKKHLSRYDEDKFFDFETEEFNPEYQFHKEYIYPSPIVYVTTYDVRFFPTIPDGQSQLKDLLEKAIDILKDIPPRFGNPVGMVSTADPYERPRWLALQDNGVMIENRIDLDDLYNIYYLLESMIVPSSSIAQTLSGAGLVEARSTIKTFDQLRYGTDYSVENSPKVDQLCVIPKYKRGPLEESLKSIFTLYVLGRLDEEGLVQQTMSLADMALQGQITNQSKTLLTFEGIKAKAEEAGQDVVPYGEVLTDLTSVFVKAMCGVAPDVTVSHIGNLVFQTAARERGGIVSALQGVDKKDWDTHEAKFHALVSRTDKPDLDISGMIAEHDKGLAISDALSGYKGPTMQGMINGEKDKDSSIPQDKAITTTSRLVVRDPEIEPCISTTFDDTPYTSRMSGDPFPRLSLPLRLQPFLDPEHTPVAQQALLSFQLK